VFVGAFARQNLVADDDGTKFRAGSAVVRVLHVS